MSIADRIHARKRRSAQEFLNENCLAEARDLYQSLVRQDPNDADAWLMLGIVAGRSGDIETARSLMRRALAAAPESAEAWLGYGQVLEKEGRLIEAGQAYFKAVSIDSRLTEAYACLGQICLHRSQYIQAAHHLRSALETDIYRPELMFLYLIDRTGVKAMYGHAQRYGGDPYKAADVYRSLLEESPGDPDLLQKLSGTYIQLSEFDQARRYIQQGLAADPENLALKSNEVWLLCLEQRFDEALEKVRPLFATATNNVQVAVNFARVCHLTGERDTAIARLENLARSTNRDLRENSLVYFELGRLYDAAKDYDKAFSWYHKANELQKGEYDRELADEEVTALIEGYSRDNLVAAARSTNDVERPVFIIGMPRSGTTLVEQILASHPEVHGAGELAKLKDLVREYRSRMPGSKTERRRAECSGFTTEALDDLADQYLGYISELADQERYVTDKMPGNFFRLGAISLMFPKAHIIHCRRNPIDTCLSCYFQNFTGYHPHTHDFESLANYYRNYRRLMDHWLEVLDLPILEVDYEVLVADQEAQTRRLLEFLDLQWDERCLQYHKSKRTTVTASYDQVNKPIYTTSVERWKRYEKHLAPLIELLGDAAGPVPDQRLPD